MARSALDKATLDELTGHRRKLEEMLPVDAEQQEMEAISHRLDEANDEALRLDTLVPWRGSERNIVYSFEDKEGYFDQYCDACDRLEELTKEAEIRRRELKELIDRRLKLCSVYLEIPDLDGDELMRHLMLGWFRFRVSGSGTFRACMQRRYPLTKKARERIEWCKSERVNRARRGLEAFTQRLLDRQRWAIERSRSAIMRWVAAFLLQALIDQADSLAAEALDLVRPELQPRVLSAGGTPGLFVLRC